MIEQQVIFFPGCEVDIQFRTSLKFSLKRLIGERKKINLNLTTQKQPLLMFGHISSVFLMCIFIVN